MSINSDFMKMIEELRGADPLASNILLCALTVSLAIVEEDQRGVRIALPPLKHLVDELWETIQPIN